MISTLAVHNGKHFYVSQGLSEFCNVHESTRIEPVIISTYVPSAILFDYEMNGWWPDTAWRLNDTCLHIFIDLLFNGCQFCQSKTSQLADGRWLLEWDTVLAVRLWNTLACQPSFVYKRPCTSGLETQNWHKYINSFAWVRLLSHTVFWSSINQTSWFFRVRFITMGNAVRGNTYSWSTRKIRLSWGNHTSLTEHMVGGRVHYYAWQNGCQSVIQIL